MSSNIPPENGNTDFIRLKDFQALLQGVDEADNVSSNKLEQGIEFEMEESQYLDDSYQAYKSFCDWWGNVAKASKIVGLLVFVRTPFILFLILLVAGCFVFGWYIILCQGSGRVLYIVSLFQGVVPHPTFVVSEQPFHLEPVIITGYMAVFVAQTFILLKSIHDVVMDTKGIIERCSNAVGEIIRIFAQLKAEKPPS